METFEDDEDDDFVLFFDAQKSLEIFLSVQTQWNVGMSGITGLNYSSVIEVIKLHEAKKKKRLTLLYEVSAIERGYLMALSEKEKGK